MQAPGCGQLNVQRQPGQGLLQGGNGILALLHSQASALAPSSLMLLPPTSSSLSVLEPEMAAAIWEWKKKRGREGGRGVRRRDGDIQTCSLSASHPLLFFSSLS